MMELVISSCVLILAVVVLRALFRRRISQRLQYGIWLVVALRLLIPVQLGSASFSVGNAVRQSPQTAQVEAFTRRPVNQLAQAAKPQQNPAPAKAPSATPTPAKTALTVGQVLWGIYFVGVGATLLWSFGVNARFRRYIRREAQPLTAPESPIPVWVSAQAPSPCLTGLFRPAVYLTPGCLEDEKQRRHVLTHELTHYRHGDQIWSHVRCLCLCLHWYNPLVWLAAWLSRQDCELACDEGTLRRLAPQERMGYGRTLVRTAADAAMAGRILHTATSMGESREQIKERVTRIARRPRTMLTAAACMLLVVAVAAGCTFAGAAQPPEANPVLPDPLAAVPQETEPLTPISVNNKLLDLPPVAARTADEAAWLLAQQALEALSDGTLVPLANAALRQEDVCLYWEQDGQLGFGAVFYLAPEGEVDEEIQTFFLGYCCPVSELPPTLRDHYPDDPNGYLSYISFAAERNQDGAWSIGRTGSTAPLPTPQDNHGQWSDQAMERVFALREEAEDSAVATALSQRIFQALFDGGTGTLPPLEDKRFQKEAVQVHWQTDRFISFSVAYALKPATADGWSYYGSVSGDVIVPWSGVYADCPGYLGFWQNVVAGKLPDGAWVVLDITADGWPALEDFPEAEYESRLNSVSGEKANAADAAF